MHIVDFQIVEAYHKHKIFFRSDFHILGLEWAWPFVDVKFYKQNSTHVWNYDYHNILAAQSDDFYPLVRRPFASMWLPTPRDTQKFLLAKFTNFSCTTSTWNHISDRRTSKAEKIGGTSCLNLANSYPYVVRSSDPMRQDSVYETVWLGNGKERFYTVKISQPYQVKNQKLMRFGVSEPFTLT